MLEPNQVFAGRYRVLQRLAEGGMGAVFECEHTGTEARVALKLLWPHVMGAESARAKFELEAKVAARVASEHIVQVLDAGFDEERRAPFLVMELLRGETLSARVGREGALPPELVLELVRQLASGLDAAHGYVNAEGRSTPIIHRDLKPDNLFLTERADGSPLLKILDFGIAKMLSESTNVSQEVRGTPMFMAFEQVMAAELSPQTDVWALGLITFYLLTGRRYWRAANARTTDLQAIFAEITTLPFAAPSARLKEIGGRARLGLKFDAWLLRCLDREPRRRFSSAGEAVRRLAKVLSDVEARNESPAAAPPEDPALGMTSVPALSTERAPTRGGGRAPALVGSVAGMAVLAVGALGIRHWMSTPSDHAQREPTSSTSVGEELPSEPPSANRERKATAWSSPSGPRRGSVAPFNGGDAPAVRLLKEEKGSQATIPAEPPQGETPLQSGDLSAPVESADSATTAAENARLQFTSPTAMPPGSARRRNDPSHSGAERGSAGVPPPAPRVPLAHPKPQPAAMPTRTPEAARQAPAPPREAPSPNAYDLR